MTNGTQQALQRIIDRLYMGENVRFSILAHPLDDDITTIRTALESPMTLPDVSEARKAAVEMYAYLNDSDRFSGHMEKIGAALNAIANIKEHLDYDQ